MSNGKFTSPENTDDWTKWQTVDGHEVKINSLKKTPRAKGFEVVLNGEVVLENGHLEAALWTDKGTCLNNAAPDGWDLVDKPITLSIELYLISDKFDKVRIMPIDGLKDGDKILAKGEYTLTEGEGMK